MNFNIVDINDLALLLKCSRSTIEKRWREFPCFFVGNSRTLKSARFDFFDVIQYLKKHGQGYERLERKERALQGPVDIQIQEKPQAILQAGVQNDVRCTSRRVEKNDGINSLGSDEYRLFDDLQTVS